MDQVKQPKYTRLRPDALESPTVRKIREQLREIQELPEVKK